MLFQSEKKKRNFFSDFFPIFPIFEIFPQIFFSRFAPRPSPPLKPPVPHGSPIIVLYRKSGKNRISDANRQKRTSDS